VLLDNLHWAGQDALDLLAGLVRDTELAADSPLSVFMADLASARLAEHLALGSLSEEESLALLGALLPGDETAETDLEPNHLIAVARRAESVAFFLVSSAENLKSGVEPDAVPWDMAQGIGQRVASLPAPARELLGVACVHVFPGSPRCVEQPVAVPTGYSTDPAMHRPRTAGCREAGQRGPSPVWPSISSLAMSR